MVTNTLDRNTIVGDGLQRAIEIQRILVGAREIALHIHTPKIGAHYDRPPVAAKFSLTTPAAFLAKS
jgi:hypothetical protein